MSLERLPRVITENEFTDDGLIKRKKDNKLLVPAYIASPHGFSCGEFSPGSLLPSFYEALEEKADIFALCPFRSCDEYLNKELIGRWERYQEMIDFWGDFNKNIVGKVNYEVLMPRSKLLIAIFDGNGSDIDSGVAAEVSFFATKFERQVIGIKSDLRLAENPVALINPAVQYFLNYGPYKGLFFNGPNAYEEAIREIRYISDGIIFDSTF